MRSRRAFARFRPAVPASSQPILSGCVVKTFPERLLDAALGVMTEQANRVRWLEKIDAVLDWAELWESDDEAIDDLNERFADLEF